MKIKRLHIVLASLSAVILVGAIATGGAAAQSGNSDSRVRIGFQIAPVPLDLHGKNRALVGVGSYLVNSASACADCHTNPTFLPGGDPYLGEDAIINQAGYLAGGKPFGPFVSRNLTPDKDGLPADLTYEQFQFVMTTGADVKGLPPFVPSQEGDLLQVMPWPFERHMSDQDLRAIYEYLRAVPCVGDAARCGN